jgi:hypothetical protein
MIRAPRHAGERPALVATARTRDHPGVSGEFEAQRIKSHYRRLVLLGKAKLPLEVARKLVGPDCAYHLYFRHDAEPPPPRPSRRRRTRSAR